MGIFARIMAGKDKEVQSEEVSVDTYLQEIAGRESGTSRQEVSELLESTISMEEKIAKLKKEKEEIRQSIEELLKGREELVKAKTSCQIIAKKKFDSKAKSFDEYIESQDFKELPLKSEVLGLIREMAPEAYQTSDLPITEIGIAVQELLGDWSELEEEVKVLKEEGGVLRTDIHQFAATISELKNKYKLSPDWEGKKPAMMTYQSKLKERREEYLRKEKQVEEQLKVLYEDYAEVYDAFASCCGFMEEVLEVKANDFAQEPERIAKLQNLLKEKQRLDLEMEGYNK